MSSLKLRPYQKEALGSLLEVARRVQRRSCGDAAGPVERVLCVQPTGAGKTIEVLALMQAVSEEWGWRTLVIVPSKGLVSQTAARACELLPGKRVGVIVGGKCQVEGYELVISTSASLNKKRLARIPRDLFQLVVVDEAHHAAAEGFKSILEHFSGARVMVGMTATYVRGDGVSVAAPEFFSSVVVYHTIGQLTTAGYLVPADGIYKHTGLTLENVPVRRGNLDEGKLAHAVNTPERNGMAVDAWLEHAGGRPTIVFCVNVDHAKDMAACFREKGIGAAAVWGEMDEAEYHGVMKDYKGGRIRVLANARLLVEGFDAPLTSAVIIARPSTQAAAAVLGPQMIGRALRPHPETGKTGAVIIELMDEKILPGRREAAPEKMTGGAPPVSLQAAAYGIDAREVECGGGKLHEKARRVRMEGAWKERRKLYEDLRSEEAVKKTFNVIERIATVSQYAWIPLGDSTYYMGLAGGDFIEVVRETPAYFEVRVVESRELNFVGSASSWTKAIEVADCWLARNGIDHYYMHRNRPWRDKSPSRAQVHTACRLTGLSETFLATLNRGQVSDLITSARALLLPVEPLSIVDSRGVKTEPGGERQFKPGVSSGSSYHVWQFQLNFN